MRLQTRIWKMMRSSRKRGEFDMQDEPGDDANIKQLNDISEEDRRIIRRK